MIEITIRRLYFAQITKYNLEEWYPNLERLNHNDEQVTAKTIFMLLDDGDLKLIQSLCSIMLANNLGMDSRETQAELTRRELLEERINELAFKTPKTYFCKLSTRSPKDSVSMKVKENEEGESLVQKMNNKISSLKVTSGEQVINLITKSQRIFSDISMYFQYRLPLSTSGQMNLIFREWVDMPQDHEFRCFVTNHHLNAISQYHCYTKFPSLQDTKYVLHIRDVITSFHESIKTGFANLPDYVMDVVVFPHNWTCQVIEVNPFGAHMSSGAGLFNWEKDEDLLCGKTCRLLPAIRILEKLIDG